MVGTPNIRFSQGGAIVVSDVAADSTVRFSMGGGMVVANFPAEEIHFGQSGAVVVATLESENMRISQAGAMVVARGRVYNPKLRAWTFTLDGHDFYVLRLAEDKTLVYDLSTGQWSWYTTINQNFWRPNIGMNWYSPGTIPENYGSNVVCGDDSFGILWILNPEQGYDEHPLTQDTVRFPRVATGQVVARQRVSLPVYEVFLTADFGQPVLTGDSVTLSYSDDLGNTYVSAGSKSVTTGSYKQQFAWRSLGLITQAGRLFQISDDGAFARLDGLDCSIGGLSN